MERFRITTQPAGEPEQTRVLLPDGPSATMQAQELSQREKGLHVRVYHERSGQERDLVQDLPPRM